MMTDYVISFSQKKKNMEWLHLNFLCCFSLFLLIHLSFFLAAMTKLKPYSKSAAFQANIIPPPAKKHYNQR
jgi:hypothetical protein